MAVSSEEDNTPGAVLAGALERHVCGIFSSYLGRYEEAADSFRLAIELEPELVGAYVELGVVYASQKEYHKLVVVLRQGIGVSPTAVRAYLGEHPLGGSPTTTPDKVGISAPASAEGAQDTVSVLVGVAMSRLASGRDREAVGALEIVLKLEPENPPAVMLLATAYLLMGAGAAEAGRRSVLRSIPELAAELFER